MADIHTGQPFVNKTIHVVEKHNRSAFLSYVLRLQVLYLDTHILILPKP
jgi:hypothetical protein